MLRFFILLFLSFFILENNSFAFAIDEAELKVPSWVDDESKKVTLKGNVNESVNYVKPQTGIGVIGLRFVHQPGYPSYIEQVYHNSPASKVGLQPRDLIFAINGIRTDKLSSDSVYELLTGEPGTKVKIFVTRGDTMFNIELVREDLANFSPDVQNRYLSGPIVLPANPLIFPYR